MYRRGAGLFLLAGSILVLAGCASAPTEELNTAQQAKDEASSAQAEKYVPDEFQKAQSTLDQAQTAMNAETNKFSAFRNYDAVKTQLAQATQEFKTAAQDAQTKKDEVQKQDQQDLADAEQALATAQSALEKAPKGKGTQADLEAMKADLDAASSSLDQARQHMQSGDYLEAQTEIQAAKSKADSVNSQIEEAIKARRGRR